MTQDPAITQDLVLQIEALKEALVAERQAREASETAAKAKSDLLAVVSHEVAKPMGAIISMADHLLSTKLDETQRHYARTLQNSGRGLLAILNDMLDFSNLETDRFELQAAAFDFRQFMAGLGEGLEAAASKKGLGCEIAIGPDCPSFAIGDALRIRQLLSNLCDNAVKFTNKGSVALKVGRVADAPGLLLRFDVADTGRGLMVEQRSQFLEPLGQAGDGVGPKAGGTGMGLSIARRLAGIMGGRIECRDRDGKGSTFSVWLPLEIADEAGLEPDQRPGQESTASELNGHVLIVEDNAPNQMLISAYLEKFGVTHKSVCNGLRALEEVQKGGFDLVLMDVMMPVMDGIEATRQIRALKGQISTIPIVALTANAMYGDRETYLKTGMNGYVSKPINAHALFLAIAEHLAGGLEATGTG